MKVNAFLFLIGMAAVAQGTSDPALLGTWDYSVPEMSINETISFPDSTHMSDKNVMGGTTFNDIDGTYDTDQTVEPNRLLITVTRSNPNQVVKAPPGSHFYCIYQVSSNLLDLNCSDPNQDVYPTDFDQALAFTKRGG
jgi:hypothetical protein